MKDELREAARAEFHKQRGHKIALPMLDIAFDAGYEAGKPKWIPVSERLPESDQVVIVAGEDTNGFKDYWAVRWDNVSDSVNEAWLRRWKVIAWMPIPPCTEGEQMSEPNALPRWEPQVHIDPILLDDCSECEAQIRELTAELKELREFVGVDGPVIGMHGTVRFGQCWYGEWGTDEMFTIYDAITSNILATGTDPFDAWRKMNAGEGE